MYLEYDDTCKFMFTVNKAARTFLQTHASTIRNGFINDGLIDYYFSDEFESFQELESLYFEALKRNPMNRIVTLIMGINDLT